MGRKKEGAVENRQSRLFYAAIGHLRGGRRTQSVLFFFPLTQLVSKIVCTLHIITILT